VGCHVYDGKPPAYHRDDQGLVSGQYFLGFVVDTLALGKFILPAFRFSLISVCAPTPRTSSLSITGATIV
jgi:hypothetical protein